MEGKDNTKGDPFAVRSHLKSTNVKQRRAAPLQLIEEARIELAVASGAWNGCAQQKISSGLGREMQQASPWKSSNSFLNLRLPPKRDPPPKNGT